MEFVFYISDSAYQMGTCLRKAPREILGGFKQNFAVCKL